jgi:hypothetical protein
MKYASAALELGGLAAVGCGAYHLAPWLGWLVAGTCAVIIGQALGGSAS